MKIQMLTTVEVKEIRDEDKAKRNFKRKHLYLGAHEKVLNAVRRGRLTPGQCEEQDETCTGNIEACHYTYERPLLVRWLCSHHHRLWDNKRRLKPGETYAF